MVERLKLVCDLAHSLGVATITIPAGTQLVSRDGGRTYRFCGFEALTVLTAAEVSKLLQQHLLQRVSG